MGFYADGPAIFGMSMALSILSVFAVAGRLYIRKIYGQGFGTDDWLMLPALSGTIGTAITLMIDVENRAVGYPAGSPEYPTIDRPFMILEQSFFAIFLINVLGLMFAKLSIIFFYRRIFNTGNNKAFNYTTIVLAIFIILWAIAFFFLGIFQCGTNVWANWGTYDELLANCISGDKIDMCYVVMDAFVDLALFIMPIPLIVRLKMSIARRLAVLLIFIIGALTLVSSLIRVIFFVGIYSDVFGEAVVNQDPILEYSIFLYWTMLESGLAVIVACLPTFQVWFRKVTVDTVMKNVRGILSIQSFSRSSRASAQQKSREATSSEASLQRASFEMLPSKEIAVKSEIIMEVTPNTHASYGLEY